MSTISKCPKCREEVTVPDGVDPAARVRCPLCEVEYPLSEAMAEAPPALIVVDGSAVGGLQTGSDAVAAAADTETAVAGDDAPALDVWQKVDETPAIDFGEGAGATPAIDTGDAPVGTEAFAAIDTTETEGAYEPAEGAPAARPRKKRKKKSGGRQVVEAIVGGFLGLTIGYYILAWCFGARVDLPKLPLPFLPHTMGKSDEADKNADDASVSSDGQGKKSAAAQSAKPKSPPDDGSTSPLPGPKSNDTTDAGFPTIEPPPFAPMPEPEPQPLPAGYVGPRVPPSFTSAELGLVLKAAHEALSGEEATGEMTDEVYRQLCRLAYFMTFVDQEGSQLADRKSAIQRILEDLAASPAKRSRIALHARGRLDQQDRVEDGVLLAGYVRRIVDSGGLQGATLQLTDPDVLVTVLSKPPLPIAEDDEVLLLGSIVDNPAENFVGYPGSKNQIVWGAMAVKAP